MASKVNTRRISKNVNENDQESVIKMLRHINECIYFTVQHQNLVKQKKQLKLTIQKLANEILIEMKTNDKLKSELDLIRKTINEKEAQLKEVNAKFEEMKKKDGDCMRILFRREQNYEDLYLRFCRSFLIERRGLRHIEIRFELNRVLYHINKKKSIRNHLTKITETGKLNMIKIKIEITNRTSEMEKQRNCVKYQNKLIYNLVTRRNDCQIAKNELQLKKDVLQREIYYLKEDLSQTELGIRCLVKPSIISGIVSVRKVLDTFRQQKGFAQDIVKGYYGLVIENIYCNKDFYIAVENTAKDNLFCHIVETEQIGIQILEEIKKQKLPGVFTFIPLRRLYKKFIRYPSHVCYLLQNTIPLMTKLHFDSKFERVMEFIFGNMIICQNLDIASSFTRLTEFDYMVLDGDQLSGDSITGGSFAPNNSILEKYINRIKIMKQIYEREFELVVLDQELENKDRHILELVEAMQASENKHLEAKISFDKLHEKIQLAKNKLNNLQRTHNINNEYIVQYDLDLEMMDLTKECLKSELDQVLFSELSLSQQCRMMHCYVVKKKLSYQNKETSDNRIKYELEKNKLENTLKNYLYRRLDDIEYKLEDSVEESLKNKLKIVKKDLELTRKSASNLYKTALPVLEKIKERKQKDSKEHNVITRKNFNKSEPPAKRAKLC